MLTLGAPQRCGAIRIEDGGCLSIRKGEPECARDESAGAGVVDEIVNGLHVHRHGSARARFECEIPGKTTDIVARKNPERVGCRAEAVTGVESLTAGMAGAECVAAGDQGFI